MFDIRRKFEISNAKNDELIIDIEGVIGSWWDGNEKGDIKRTLKKVTNTKSSRIIVNIDSPGGRVSDALSIHDALAQHKAKVIVNITGMTASAATIIAMAGDEINMSDNSLILVHNASNIAWGDKNTMKEMMEDLEKIDETIAKIYSKRTGNSIEDELEQMNVNNGVGEWLTADEAKEKGFIDNIFEPSNKAAAFTSIEEAQKIGMNIPQNIIDNLNNKDMNFKEELNNLKNWLTDQFKNLTPDEEGKVEIPEEITNKISELEAKADEMEVSNSQDLATANETIETLNADIASKDQRISELETENLELTGEVNNLKASGGGEKPETEKDPDPENNINPADKKAEEEFDMLVNYEY